MSRHRRAACGSVRHWRWLRGEVVRVPVPSNGQHTENYQHSNQNMIVVVSTSRRTPTRVLLSHDQAPWTEGSETPATGDAAPGPPLGTAYSCSAGPKDNVSGGWRVAQGTQISFDCIRRFTRMSKDIEKPRHGGSTPGSSLVGSEGRLNGPSSTVEIGATVRDPNYSLATLPTALSFSVAEGQKCGPLQCCIGGNGTWRGSSPGARREPLCGDAWRLNTRSTIRRGRCSPTLQMPLQDRSWRGKT